MELLEYIFCSLLLAIPMTLLVTLVIVGPIYLLFVLSEHVRGKK